MIHVHLICRKYADDWQGLSYKEKLFGCLIKKLPVMITLINYVVFIVLLMNIVLIWVIEVCVSVLLYFKRLIWNFEMNFKEMKCVTCVHNPSLQKDVVDDFDRPVFYQFASFFLVVAMISWVVTT